MRNEVLTVSALTRAIRDVLDGEFSEVLVEGEVSNLRRQASGHCYFTLKDAGAQIACVQFKQRFGAPQQRSDLADGMQVRVQGRLAVYEPRGQYQIIVSLVQPKGLGDLQAKFEALKRKLDAEGLFDPGSKRALPEFPLRIAVVTSPTGAALRDMLHVLARRSPWVEVLVAPVRVQGAGAAEEIARAITALANPALPSIDLTVVTRGGGSIEDLWAFNEEVVARAIRASEVPVVSAVGHEIDFTIADFAADMRAPTPSAAAEILAPDLEELDRRIARLRSGMRARFVSRIESAKESMARFGPAGFRRAVTRRVDVLRQTADSARARCDDLALRHFGSVRLELSTWMRMLRGFHPAKVLAGLRERGAMARRALESAVPRRVAEARLRHSALEAVLLVLGPQATLDRGFSVTLLESGQVVTDPAGIPEGTILRTKTAGGELRSQTLRDPSS